jgi:hypothetical protein
VTIVDSWREKSDRELTLAAKRIEDYTEEEERIIREEMIRRGMPEPPPRGTPPQHWLKRRSTLLNLLLGYFVVGNLYVAYRNAEIYWDLVSHSDPNLPHWPFLAFSILSVIVIVSIIGLWFWKKWGFYLFIIAQIASVFVALFLINSLGLSQIFATVLVGSIGPTIFLAAMYQKWDLLE